MTTRRTTRRRMNTAAAMTQPLTASPAWTDSLQSIPRSKIVAGVCLLGCVIALALFFNTDYFYVFKFEISGTQFLTTAEIEKASGTLGYSIFFFETRTVERALAKLPEVQAVRVTSQLPNRVRIELVERTPQIVWQRGTEVWWVDAEGVFMRARAALPQLPAIRDLDQTPLQAGQRAQPQAIAALTALRAAMPISPRTFEWSQAAGLAFTDERGWKIYLGDAREMPGKVVVLRALTAQLVAQNARIKFIDLGKGDPYYQ